MHYNKTNQILMNTQKKIITEIENLMNTQKKIIAEIENLMNTQKKLITEIENLHNKYAVTVKQVLAERDAQADQLNEFLVELGYE